MHAGLRTLQGEELDLQIPGIKMCAKTRWTLLDINVLPPLPTVTKVGGEGCTARG